MDHTNFYGALREQRSEDEVDESFVNANFPGHFSSDENDHLSKDEDSQDVEVIRRKERKTIKMLD